MITLHIEHDSLRVKALFQENIKLNAIEYLWHKQIICRP